MVGTPFFINSFFEMQIPSTDIPAVAAISENKEEEVDERSSIHIAFIAVFQRWIAGQWLDEEQERTVRNKTSENQSKWTYLLLPDFSLWHLVN